MKLLPIKIGKPGGFSLILVLVTTSAAMLVLSGVLLWSSASALRPG